MRVKAEGSLHDVAQLVREQGGKWDAGKLDRLRDLGARLLAAGGQDTLEVGSYIASLYRDPRTKFDAESKQRLHGLLLETFQVDPSELKDFKVPDPVSLQYIDAASNSKKFYRLEVKDSSLLISNGRIGTKGVNHPPLELGSPEGAVKEYHRRLREKLREGYQRTLTAPPPVLLAFKDDRSDKFYGLSVEGNTLIISNGRTGTKGQVHKKPFASAASAIREMERRRREKLHEGYAQAGGPLLPHLKSASAPLPVPVVAPPIEAEEKYPRVTTMAEWKALPLETQEEILDDMGYWPERYPGIKKVEDVPLAKLAGDAEKKLAKRMVDEVGDLEVDSDYHATVGPTEIKVSIYKLADGQIIGGKLDYYQNGADNDGAGGYFATEAKAKAAGCEFSDVNWQAHATFNHELEPLGEKPYYLEWSGY